MKVKYFLLFALLLLLAACQASPAAVAEKYMDAVQRNDADAMIALVSDDVVMVVDGGPFFQNELTGKEALRDYLQGNSAVGFRLEVTGSPIVDGDRVTYPDRFAMVPFEEMGVAWVMGQDVVTIANGKVTRDVWTIDEASIQELGEAFAALAGLTVDKLAGVWRWDGGPGVGVSEMRYQPDGTYTMIRLVVDSEVLWDAGSFAIEDDNVILTTSAAHYCAVGDRGVYQAAITEDGRLEMRLVEDSCWRRRPPVEEPFYLELATP
jgi:ketosteroid isomerase-like protein